MEIEREALKKYSKEEIRAAKKTVQIITEINGEKFVNTYDGTEALLVCTTKDEKVLTDMQASAYHMQYILSSIVQNLPPAVVLPALLSMMGGGEKHEVN